jgi:hypothetical protein
MGGRVVSGLLRAFADMEQARPWHSVVIGAALLVGLVLLSAVPQ